MAEQPMIELKNVTKVYPNGTVGLKDINLKINKGEFVVLLGFLGPANQLCCGPSTACMIFLKATS